MQRRKKYENYEMELAIKIEEADLNARLQTIELIKAQTRAEIARAVGQEWQNKANEQYRSKANERERRSK